jgi:hypothetical protein
MSDLLKYFLVSEDRQFQPRINLFNNGVDCSSTRHICLCQCLNISVYFEILLGDPRHDIAEKLALNNITHSLIN